MGTATWLGVSSSGTQAGRPMTPSAVSPTLGMMTTTRSDSDRSRRVDGAGERAFVPTLVATLAWFVVPALLFAIWTLLFGGSCDGQNCGRLTRIGSGLSSAMTWAFPSLALSLLIAVLLRLPAVGWRSGATGTAAAILGAGLTTVVLTSVGYDIG